MSVKNNYPLYSEFNLALQNMPDYKTRVDNLKAIGGIFIVGGGIASIPVGLMATSYVAIPLLICLGGIICGWRAYSTVCYNDFDVWQKIRKEAVNPNISLEQFMKQYRGNDLAKIGIFKSLTFKDNKPSISLNDPVLRERYRNEAVNMNLGQLMDRWEIEILHEYEILTFEERLQKWEQWKKAPELRNQWLRSKINNDQNFNGVIQKLFRYGFVPVADFEAWTRYFNKSNVDQIKGWETFCHETGCILSNEERIKYKNSIKNKLIENIIGGSNWKSISKSSWNPLITRSEYALMEQFATELSTINPDDALALYQLDISFKDKFKRLLDLDINQVIKTEHTVEPALALQAAGSQAPPGGLAPSAPDAANLD